MRDAVTEMKVAENYHRRGWRVTPIWDADETKKESEEDVWARTPRLFQQEYEVKAKGKRRKMPEKAVERRFAPYFENPEPEVKTPTAMAVYFFQGKKRQMVRSGDGDFYDIPWRKMDIGQIRYTAEWLATDKRTMKAAVREFMDFLSKFPDFQ